MPLNNIGTHTHDRSEDDNVDSNRKKQKDEWCPININEEQCGRYPSGKIGVLDVISQRCIEHEQDVFDANDGHCYEREGLITWFEGQRFRRGGNGARLPPQYPTTNIKFTENDVRRLGIQNYEFPTEENKYRLAHGEHDPNPTLFIMIHSLSHITQLKIKLTTLFRKVYDAYNARHFSSLGQCEIYYKGNLVDVNDTALSLNLLSDLPGEDNSYRFEALGDMVVANIKQADTMINYTLSTPQERFVVQEHQETFDRNTPWVTFMEKCRKSFEVYTTDPLMFMLNGKELEVNSTPRIDKMRNGDFIVIHVIDSKEFKSLQIDAESGDPIKQFKLGALYAIGEGVETNHAESFKWYKLAAKQGHAGAQGALGFYFYAAIGVEKDVFASLTWLVRAKKNGNTDSILMLTIQNIFQSETELLGALLAYYPKGVQFTNFRAAIEKNDINLVGLILLYDASRVDEFVKDGKVVDDVTVSIYMSRTLITAWKRNRMIQGNNSSRGDETL